MDTYGIQNVGMAPSTSVTAVPETKKDLVQEQPAYIQRVDIVEVNRASRAYNPNFEYGSLQAHPLTAVELKTLNANLDVSFRQFYAGEISLEELEDIMVQAYDSVKELAEQFNANSPGTNQLDVEETALRHTSNYFLRFGTGWGAMTATRAEGSKVADKYGAATDKDWIYYSAAVYFKAEDMKSMAMEVLQRLTAETGKDIAAIVPSNEESFSYNALWNQGAKAIFAGATSVSLDIGAKPPPEDFTFFYKATQCSAEDLKYGQTYIFTAQNPYGDDGEGIDWHITIPRGQNLLKQGSLLESLGVGNWYDAGDFKGYLVDITRYVSGSSNKNFSALVNQFLAKNINNARDGVVVVGSNQFSIASQMRSYSEYGTNDLLKLDGMDIDPTHTEFLKNFSVFHHG